MVAKDKVASEAAKTLIERVGAYLPEDSTELVGQAYRYADECHVGQMRQSGEPYIAHPLQTALFLADLHLDTHTIVAALLHDVVEDCGVSLDEIDRRFGPEVSKLVDGVTKLTRMDDKLQPPAEDIANLMDDAESLHAESLRKMLVSMAEDIRVVLISWPTACTTCKPWTPSHRKSESASPRNPGHLLAPGPPPGNLGDQMALG